MQTYYIYASKMSGFAGYNKNDQPVFDKRKWAPVQVDGGKWWISDSSWADLFRGTFGASGGTTAYNGTYLDFCAADKREPVISLADVNADLAPARTGIALCDRRPNTTYSYLNHTYYLRIPDVTSMKPSDKAKEVSLIMCADDKFWNKVRERTGQSLVFSAGILVLFLCAMVTLPALAVVRAAFLLLGFAAVAAPVASLNALTESQRKYQQALANATSIDGLEEAAEHSANWWVALLELLISLVGVAQVVNIFRSGAVTEAAAEGALRRSKSEFVEEKPTPITTKRAAMPKKLDWKEGYEFRKREAVKYLEKAVKARANEAEFNANILEALDNEFHAQRALYNAKVMRGHSLVIEDVGRFFNKNILPSLKQMSPKRLQSTFQTMGIEIDIQQSAQLCKDMVNLKEVEFEGHDWTTPEIGKQVGWINDGMANPHPKLSAATMKILEDPGVSADAKLEAFRNDSAMVNIRKDLKSKVAKLVDDSFYSMHRSIETTRSTMGHIGETHHTPVSLEDYFHAAIDTIHSKIMKGRTYQVPQLLQAITFRKSDGFVEVARFRMAIYTFEKYMQGGGQYTEAQVINCVELSDLKL